VVVVLEDECSAAEHGLKEVAKRLSFGVNSIAWDKKILEKERV